MNNINDTDINILVPGSVKYLLTKDYWPKLESFDIKTYSETNMRFIPCTITHLTFGDQYNKKPEKP
nr:hypothetical protein [Megavirus caiporensis]